MSRYFERLSDGKELVWGYDEPLKEYFIQLYKSPSDLVDEYEEGLIFSIANWNTVQPHPEYPEKFKYTNREILEVLMDFKVAPTEHTIAIAIGLPF